MIKGAAPRFAGDPRRVAEAVQRIATLDDPPLHLLLGRDVYDAYRAKLRDLAEQVEAWKDVTLDIDFRDD
jgi:hypothetical protein